MKQKTGNKPRLKLNKSGAITHDSFRNFMTNLGIGADNTFSASGYAYQFISRNRTFLENAYSGSWVCGQAVDLIAEDMTREGVEFDDGLSPDHAAAFNHIIERMKVWECVQDVLKWSRLFGGAILVPLIEGHDLSQPLDIDTVGRGQFKGFYVFDRWMVTPSLTDTINTLSPEVGEPEYYNVDVGGNPFNGLKIHHNRCWRFDGVKMPYYRRQYDNGWGQSIIERLWDRLLSFDSATQGTAQLVYKAHLRTMQVDGLRELIALGGKQYQALVENINMIRKFQSSEGLTLMDAKDQFEAHSYTFTGLSDVILQFGQQISGATQIPLVRFFGQSPAGLNSTGESDLRTYYDMIRSKQEKDLRPVLYQVFSIIWRSAFGIPLPKDFGFSFRSLWQLTPEQKAAIVQQTSTAIIAAYDSQIISRKTALNELKKSGQSTGIFSLITDEEIEEAEFDAPPGMGETGIPEAMLEARKTQAIERLEEKAGIAPESHKESLMARLADKIRAFVGDSSWNEADHPRDEDGKFGKGGGGGGKKATSISAEKMKERGITADMPIGELKSKAKEIASSYVTDKPVTIESDNRPVLIPKTGIDKTFIGRVSRVAAIAATELPTVIRNAEYVDSYEDDRKRQNIVEIHKYKSSVDIAGYGKKEVALLVREMTDGNRYYDCFEER